MAQRRIDVSTTLRKHEHHETKPTDMAGWMISDLTVGYLSGNVVLGKTLKVMVGLTNLTTSDVTLHFKTLQRVRLRVTDSAGVVIFETPEDKRPNPADETIPAAKGTYWSESVDLKIDQFKSGSTYGLDGVLVSTTFPGTARVAFTIP